MNGILNENGLEQREANEKEKQKVRAGAKKRERVRKKTAIHFKIVDLIMISHSKKLTLYENIQTEF